MEYVPPDKLLNGRKVVLVVESKLIRELLTTTVKQAGVKSILVGSCVEMLRQVETFAPDLIFCEYELGTVTGADFVRQLRADHKMKTPTVVLVPNELAEAPAKARAAGANETVSIPFSVRDILAVARKLIEHGPDGPPTVKLRFGPRSQ